MPVAAVGHRLELTLTDPIPEQEPHLPESTDSVLIFLRHLGHGIIGAAAGCLFGLGIQIFWNLIQRKQWLLNPSMIFGFIVVGFFLNLLISIVRTARSATKTDTSSEPGYQSVRYPPIVVWTVLSIIMLVAVFLRLYCFTGMRGMDDVFYAELAFSKASGDEQLAKEPMPPVFHNRLGLFWSAAFFVKLLGSSEAGFLAYPFLISIASIPLAFFITRHFFGDLSGLIASLLLAFLPWDIHMATGLFPDVPGALWGNLGVLLCVLGAGRKGLPQSLFGGGAGLCFGISWLHKASVVYLVPLIGAYLLYLIWKRRSSVYLLIGTAVGSLLILGAEMGGYAYTQDDAFHRFHTIEENWTKYGMYFFKKGSPRGYQNDRDYFPAVSKRILLANPRLIFGGNEFAYLTTIAMIVAIWSWWARRREFAFCAFWFVSLVVMFNFCSTTFSSYMPLVLASKRYVFSIMMPAIALTAGALGFAIHRALASTRNQPAETTDKSAPSNTIPKLFFARPVTAAKELALVLVVVVTWCYLPGMISEFKRRPSCEFIREAVKIVEPTDLVYTNHRAKKLLRFFWGYPEQMNTKIWPMNAKKIKNNAYVVVWRWRLKHEARKFRGRRNHPAYTSSPPRSWTLLGPDDRRIQSLGVVYQAHRK